MHMIKQKFKKGAASFYIVAFSTLILLIVATSFAAIIISEIGRTSDDDLSQSAYDSAQAGIEDAKLAIYSYQNCLEQGNNPDATCTKIISEIEKPDCDMVGVILGRNNGGEVPVKEDANNNMRQAYTCVKVDTILGDYVATLSESKQMKVIAPKFDGVASSQIKRIKLSWLADSDTVDSPNFRFSNFPDSKVVFPGSTTAPAVPPTISLGLVQTSNSFRIEDFETSKNNQTNRGLIYLVPTNGQKAAQPNNSNASEWDNSKKYNKIGANAFIKSNDKRSTNLPYTVNCSKSGNAGNDYACSAMVELPDPIGGTRNDDTFRIVVSLPYGKPNTTFSLEFYCDTLCTTQSSQSDDVGGSTTTQTDRANLKNVQINVDSTGRANDLYRRLETRLEPASNGGNLMIYGPLELMSDSDSGDNSNKNGLEKNITTKCEYNFYSPELNPTC